MYRRRWPNSCKGRRGSLCHFRETETTTNELRHQEGEIRSGFLSSDSISFSFLCFLLFSLFSSFTTVLVRRHPKCRGFFFQPAQTWNVPSLCESSSLTAQFSLCSRSPCCSQWASRISPDQILSSAAHPPICSSICTSMKSEEEEEEKEEESGIIWMGGSQFSDSCYGSVSALPLIGDVFSHLFLCHPPKQQTRRDRQKCGSAKLELSSRMMQKGVKRKRQESNL